MGMKQISYTISWYVTNTVKGLFVIILYKNINLNNKFFKIRIFKFVNHINFWCRININ